MYKRQSDICEQKGGNDTFFNMTMINVDNLSPTVPKAGLSEQQCREECLKKWRCQAYFYSPTTRNPNNLRDSANNNKSWRLTSELELTNIQEDYASTDHDVVYNLSIRVATLQNGNVCTFLFKPNN